MTDILNNPNNETREKLWEYFILKNIDINATSLNNKNLISDTGFSQSGYIFQLFSIFKNNEIFSIFQKKQELCSICGYLFEYEEVISNISINIDEYYIKFKSIEQILTYKLIMEGYSSCRKCKLAEDIKTANISYKIVQNPNFLFVLYDMKSYIDLKNFIIQIKLLSKKTIKFSDSEIYDLIGFVATTGTNHFTYFINKINLNNIPDNLSLNKKYYYDDMLHNAKFVEMEDFESLFTYTENPIIPYLLVYEKK